MQEFSFLEGKLSFQFQMTLNNDTGITLKIVLFETYQYTKCRSHA